MPLPQRKLIPGILLFLMLAALAAPPIWWSQGTDPVISTTAAANNHGPANIGQAKHMAKSALDALALVLPATAAAIEADLVGPGKPIPSWNPPANQAEKDKNHAPLLLGQLKAIAHPFYNHLNTAAPAWVLEQIQHNHNSAAILGTHYWRVTGNQKYTENGYFPWNPTTPADKNKAIATIGQLKAIFSLRFETLVPPTVDSDGDGLADAWELQHFVNLSQTAEGDFDNDGFSNIQEYYFGTAPNDASKRPLGKIACGASHSVALTAEGRLWTWGYNDYGQLGDGTTTTRSSPVPLIAASEMSSIVEIGAGENFTLALDDQGTLWGWGTNDYRHLSTDPTSRFLTPVKIGLPGPISRFACGSNHALALGGDGRIWAWGRNSFGQLGQAHTNIVSGFVEIVRPAGMQPVSSLSATGSSSYALDVSGKMWAWGENGSGKLGDGSSTSRYTPVAVDVSNGVPAIKAIVPGRTHTLALGSDSSIWSWGSNSYGQLGLGNYTSSKKPVRLTEGLTTANILSAGYYHSVALSPSGAVWAWGRNSEGQLGNSSTTLSNLPVQTSAVAGWADIIGLASGTYHNLGIKSDGSIWSWGYNSYGQLGLGDTATRTAPVLLANLKLANDDTDSDGLPDSWERFYFGGSLSQSAGDIAVTGGVTNLVAYTQRLNPVSGDTDNDGMLDGWEITNSLLPLSDDSLEDKDGDRIPNIFEFMRGKTNANNASSKPATTFIVDPSTGGNSTTDNIYTTIQAAITQANRYVYNSVTSQYEYPDRYAVIEVKAGTYPEQVNISDVPVLLLGELGAPSGPVTITGRTDYDNYTLSIATASAVDGFIITHAPGRKGVGVQVFQSSGSASNRRRIVNCAIRGNDNSHGGAVYNTYSFLDLVHCTITNNKANSYGRGIYSFGGKLKLINSILWGNGGTATQEVYKNSSDPVSVISSIIANGEHGGINIEPQLTPPGWLKSSSPAINRSGTVPTSASSVDIHGEPRPIGSTPDIGADEFLSSDGDTLPDFWELRYFGNLSKGDGDDSDLPSGDGLSNYYEYHFDFNPLLPVSPGNVVSDFHEAIFRRKNDANYPAEWKTDDDHDGLTAGEELFYGSNPLLADSNGDGLADGISLNMGISPISNDTDGDGVSNAAELANGTNPLLADTDGDGVEDHLDAYPLDPGRTSVTPGAAGDTVAPIITLIEPVGALPVP